MDYIVVVLLIMTGVIIFVLRYYQQNKRKPVTEVIGMPEIGYTPASYADATLRRNVGNLHTKYPDQELVLHDVFIQEHPDCQVSLFDIQDVGSKQPTWLARDMVAVTSQQMNTPRVTILTRANVTGKFGNLFDRFLHQMANWENNTQGLKQVDLQEQSNVNQRYLVFAVDEDRARRFLTPECLGFLASLSNHYMIDTFGDTLTIACVIEQPGQSRKDRILQTTEDAIAISKLFSSQ
jgi:hypothetical protein